MGVLCTEYTFPQNPNGFYRGPMGRARSRLKNRHKKRSTCEKSQVLNLIYTLWFHFIKISLEMCLFLFCAYYELASNKVLRSRFLLQHPLYLFLHNHRHTVGDCHDFKVFLFENFSCNFKGFINGVGRGHMHIFYNIIVNA